MPLNTPVAPTLSSPSPSSFTLTKNPDGNPFGTYYVAMVNFGTSTFYVASGGTLSSVPIFFILSSVTVLGLNPNTNYTVSLAAASDSAGDDETAFGSAAGVTTLANLPIAQPYLGVFSTTVTAFWNANGNPTGTQFDVQLSTDPGFVVNVIDSGWVTSLDFMFVNLLPSTIYYGQVRARNAVLSTTSFVSLGPVTTLAGPANVRALQVTNLLDDRGFLLQWAPNLENNIVAYKVYRSNSPTDISSFALLNSVAPNVTSYIDNVPFTFGLTYYYIVTALDNGGNESSLDTANPTQDMSFHSFEEQPFPVVIQSGNIIDGEVPSGAIDGVNTLYTTAYPYKSNTLAVYVNGLKLPTPTNSFVLNPPQQFTITGTPLSGVLLTVSYIRY